MRKAFAARLAPWPEYNFQIYTGLFLVVGSVLCFLFGAFMETIWSGNVNAVERGAGYFDMAVQAAVLFTLLVSRLRGGLWVLSALPILVAIACDLRWRVWLGQDPSWLHLVSPACALLSGFLTALLTYRDVQSIGGTQTPVRPGVEIRPRQIKALFVAAFVFLIIVASSPAVVP